MRQENILIPRHGFKGRIAIPVTSQFMGKLCVTDDGAYIKDSSGVITWSYSNRMVTGKGIFVAATVCSGTMYIAKILSAIGYDIGHESAAPDGSVGYQLVVVKPKNCFHQVRHPVEQISSSTTLVSWGFIPKVIDIDIDTLTGRMQCWLEWNKMCEEFCVWRYRIEDLPNIWSEFLERINHKQVTLPEVSTKENSRKHLSNYKKLTWADLFEENVTLAQEITDKAKEYGYDTDRLSPTG